MPIVANSADPGNTFPAFRSNNEHRSIRITGFDLTHIIELSPLPKSVTRVLKFACNLAGSTSDFIIIKSLRNLAEEAGCSISTVQRAYRAAVKLGILSYEEQRDEKNHSISKPSKYTFTSKALCFVRASLDALKEANLKPSGRQNIVRRVIAKAFFKNDFIHNTPSQNEQASPGQNDQQEVRDHTRKRKIKNREPIISEVEKSAEQPPAPVKNFGFYQDTQKQLAAASSAAQNERRAAEFQRKGRVLHEAYQALKSTFKTKPAGGQKQKSRRYVVSLNGDCTKGMDYSIPKGFRGY
ncbi:helix-turn-helix domain-containing protein [Pantoea sp. Ft+CA_17]|uniref:helix-turn-helix domain-containing protein n=1 Tax=Pantoea sp. Ft+CA_17 TaxID=2929508 RepID=UPI002118CE81|nr:helix-turn-helix domain-containing protein [Pantoea sp. Ft+CA_17]